MQGNKGGPALALSIVKSLNKYIDNVEYIFAVSSGDEFIEEQRWADIFDVKVIEELPIRSVHPLNFIKKPKSTSRRIASWYNAFRSSDKVISMNGVCYVGPPVGSQKFSSVWSRFRIYLSAKLFGKKFVGWTQSYGPFTTPWIRAMAKLDLGSQEVIFCRGEDCVSVIKALLPNSNAVSYPDVAIILNYDKEKGRIYLTEKMNLTEHEKLVTVSPSAVLYSKSVGQSSSNKHVQELRAVCIRLIGSGYRVLLVPHTYRVGSENPNLCDYVVSKFVADGLEGVDLVTENLSPIDLKSIISNAYIHIGARYHSLVASLSTGIPSISLSWHSKYKDLMREFSLDEYVYDSVNMGTEVSLDELIDKLISKHEDLCIDLRTSGLSLEEKIFENASLIAEQFLRKK